MAEGADSRSASHYVDKSSHYAPDREEDTRLRCPMCRKVLAEELDGKLRVRCLNKRCRARIIFDTNGKTVIV